MVLTKLIRQHGRYGNKCSLLEVGDTVNALLEELKQKKVVKVEADEKVEAKRAVKKPTPKAKKNRVGEVVRTRGSGDRVYYILENKRQWVENPDILRKLGFDFPDINEIECIGSYIGFKSVNKCKFGVSDHEVLCSLETRKEQRFSNAHLELVK